MKNRISISLAAALALSGTLASASSASAGTDAYVGEVMLVGFTFCPQGSLPAAGQTLSISSNQALFALYGTTYGGDGQTTFNLPDLRGRAAINNGNGSGLSNYALGQNGGQESFTITTDQMPPHTHNVQASNQLGTSGGPSGRFLAGQAGDNNPFIDGPANRTMNSAMITPTGGGQPITNRGPYLAMQWCVVTQGIFPSRP